MLNILFSSRRRKGVAWAVLALVMAGPGPVIASQSLLIAQPLEAKKTIVASREQPQVERQIDQNPQGTFSFLSFLQSWLGLTTSQRNARMEAAGTENSLQETINNNLDRWLKELTGPISERNQNIYQTSISGVYRTILVNELAKGTNSASKDKEMKPKLKKLLTQLASSIQVGDQVGGIEHFLETDIAQHELVRRAWYYLWSEKTVGWSDWCAKWTKIAATYLAYPVDLLLNLPSMCASILLQKDLHLEGYLQTRVLAHSTSGRWMNTMATTALVGLTLLGGWQFLQAPSVTQVAGLVSKLAGGPVTAISAKTGLVSLGMALLSGWAMYGTYRCAKGVLPSLATAFVVVFVGLAVCALVRWYTRRRMPGVWREMGKPLIRAALHWGLISSLVAVPFPVSWAVYTLFVRRGMPSFFAFVVGATAAWVTYRLVVAGLKEIGRPETPIRGGKKKKRKKKKEAAPLQLNKAIKSFFQSGLALKTILLMGLLVMILHRFSAKKGCSPTAIGDRKKYWEAWLSGLAQPKERVKRGRGVAPASLPQEQPASPRTDSVSSLLDRNKEPVFNAGEDEDPEEIRLNNLVEEGNDTNRANVKKEPPDRLAGAQTNETLFDSDLSDTLASVASQATKSPSPFSLEEEDRQPVEGNQALDDEDISDRVFKLTGNLMYFDEAQLAQREEKEREQGLNLTDPTTEKTFGDTIVRLEIDIEEQDGLLKNLAQNLGKIEDSITEIRPMSSVSGVVLSSDKQKELESLTKAKEMIKKEITRTENNKEVLDVALAAANQRREAALAAENKNREPARAVELPTLTLRVHQGQKKKEDVPSLPTSDDEESLSGRSRDSEEHPRLMPKKTSVCITSQRLDPSIGSILGVAALGPLPKSLSFCNRSSRPIAKVRKNASPSPSRGENQPLCNTSSKNVQWPRSFLRHSACSLLAPSLLGPWILTAMHGSENTELDEEGAYPLEALQKSGEMPFPAPPKGEISPFAIVRNVQPSDERMLRETLLYPQHRAGLPFVSGSTGNRELVNKSLHDKGREMLDRFLAKGT